MNRFKSLAAVLCLTVLSAVGAQAQWASYPTKTTLDASSTLIHFSVRAGSATKGKIHIDAYNAKADAANVPSFSADLPSIDVPDGWQPSAPVDALIPGDTVRVKIVVTVNYPGYGDYTVPQNYLVGLVAEVPLSSAPSVKKASLLAPILTSSTAVAGSLIPRVALAGGRVR